MKLSRSDTINRLDTLLITPISICGGFGRGDFNQRANYIWKLYRKPCLYIRGQKV
jgi:hypothetical protein